MGNWLALADGPILAVRDTFSDDSDAVVYTPVSTGTPEAISAPFDAAFESVEFERGVPFVEVSLNGVPDGQVFGWDTHSQNFDSVKKLCEVLDPAWSTLMLDLKRRGLLDSTLIVWMGEFGRTPRINIVAGRDHFPSAWTVALGGAGIHGGGAYGRTSQDGTTVEENPVTVPDLLSTICRALGLDTSKENQSNVGRPIRLVEPNASPIEEVLV